MPHGAGSAKRGAGDGVVGDGLSVLSEPQRGSLVPPIERQTRVGHQLVGGELRGLLSRQDRGDDIGGEESQPHEARCIRGCDIFLSRDVLKGRTAGLEQSLADFPTADQQPDQASYPPGRNSQRRRR